MFRQLTQTSEKRKSSVNIAGDKLNILRWTREPRSSKMQVQKLN